MKLPRHASGRCDVGLERPDPGSVGVVAGRIGDDIPEAAGLVENGPAAFLRLPAAAGEVVRDDDHTTVWRLASEYPSRGT